MKIVTRWMIAVVLVFTAQAATASDFALWPEVGVKVKRENKFFKGDAQLRFADNASDFNNYRVELGPGLALSPQVEVLAMYRYNPSKSAGNWVDTHYLLLDPTLKKIGLGSDGGLWLDVRGRVQLKLGNAGRSFVRIRPQVSGKVGENTTLSVNNEFFIQISSLGTRSRINQNRFSVGLKTKKDSVDLGVYYLLRSDKGAAWRHLHVVGLSVYLNK